MPGVCTDPERHNCYWISIPSLWFNEMQMPFVLQTTRLVSALQHAITGLPCACVDDAGWKPSSSGSKEFRGENSRHTHQNQHVTRLTHFMAFRKTTVVSGDNKKRIQIQSRQRTPPPTGLCFEASSLTLWLMPSCLFVLSPDVPVPPKSTLIPFLCKNTVKDKLCGCQSKSLWASFLRGRAVVIEYKYIYSSTVQF